MKEMCIYILLGILLPLNLRAQVKGKVVSIIDGDTFTLLTRDRQQMKIRLFGVDAPEQGQEYAQASKEYLGDMIFFDTVQAQIKGTLPDGTTLAVVVKLGMNINERMLQQGMAWHNTRFDSNVTWTQLENKARQLKRGLWSQPNAIAPWVWKKTHAN